jgi:hypothetical protein
MSRQIVFQLMISLFVTVQTHAMNEQMAAKPDDHGICYFDFMTVDVLNYIAQILMSNDETEEEFIVRTKIEEEPLCYCHYLNNSRFACTAIRYILCPNKTKLAMIEPEIQPQLTIINLQEEDDKKKVMSKVCLPSWKGRCVALSSSGSMFAIINTKVRREDGYAGTRLYEKKIIIRKIAEPLAEMPIKLPGLCINIYDNYRVSFNKQGTHIAVYNKDIRLSKEGPIIFPLKIIDPDKPQPIIHDTNNLQKYFREKLVCKQSIEGTK